MPFVNGGGNRVLAILEYERGNGINKYKKKLRDFCCFVWSLLLHSQHICAFSNKFHNNNISSAPLLN